MIIACIQIIAGLALLVYGADRFVSGASHTARTLGVSPLIIGLTIVGVATSAPEVLVGIVAAAQGKTNIAIGNALGSNIANIGLVLGGTVLVSPLVISSQTLRREYLIMFIAVLVGLGLMIDRNLSRMDGVILILFLAIIIWLIFNIARKARRDPLAKEYAQEFKGRFTLKISLLILVFGLVLLLAGAEVLIRGAVSLAQSFGISDLIIGLTIVAVGTSLPELAASIMSVLKNEPDIAIGNVIGSNTFNMLLVLGAPALIHPASFGKEVLLRDFSVMIALILLMGWMVFIRGHGKFSRWEGGILLGCFVAYQYWLFHSIAG